MNRILRYSIFLVPAALVLAFMPHVAARGQEVTKTIYFTAIDKDGKPVMDLKPEELAAAEDGKIHPAISAKLATTPLSIVMLADTSAVVSGAGLDIRGTSASAAGELIRDIRGAFSAFAKQMLAANPKNELALMEFGQAAIMITDFTSNGEELDKNINRLASKPDAASVLLEALMESSKELGKRSNARRAIVAINVMPDDEQSREPANNIMKEMAKDRATLFSVSLQKGDLRNAARGPLLDAFCDKTGGRHDTIVGQSALIGLLKQYGDLLSAQYELQYSRPIGAPAQLLQMATRRTGLKFLASKFPPQ